MIQSTSQARRSRLVALLIAMAAATPAAPVAAQRLEALEPAPVRVMVPDDGPGVSVGGAFLASALIPGAGQFRLGAGRWVAYAGVETWAWINWADARSDARGLEGQYRDLAWAVARRISVGGRREGDFEYYEAMSNYAESGSFDADPGATGVQPEEDASTFNGSVWALARAIFYPAGGDSIPPTEQARAAALSYYAENAIEPSYAWSWGSNRLEQEHFRTLIRRSDEAARASTTILGVILVNHVVSAIDALIAARLRGPDGQAPLRLRGETMFGPFGPTPFLVLEIATP